MCTLVLAPRRNFGYAKPTKWNNVRIFALEEAAEQIKASKRWLADQARAGRELETHFSPRLAGLVEAVGFSIRLDGEGA